MATTPDRHADQQADEETSEPHQPGPIETEAYAIAARTISRWVDADPEVVLGEAMTPIDVIERFTLPVLFDLLEAITMIAREVDALRQEP